MKHNRFIEIVICFIFLFFVIIYFVDHYTLSNMNGSYTITRKTIKETFMNSDLSDPLNLTEYDNANQPFTLLHDVLPIKENQKSGPLNSQTCYDGDFQKRLEKTGNYLQRTNNYRHEDPESCSSLYQEFVTAYYKVEPLA